MKMAKSLNQIRAEVEDKYQSSQGNEQGKQTSYLLGIYELLHVIAEKQGCPVEFKAEPPSSNLSQKKK